MNISQLRQIIKEEISKLSSQKPKAIFLAGPAGSGKSYMNRLLIPQNFQTINSDDTYEELL